MVAQTARQEQVFNFIHAKITSRGYGPTVREIGKRFGIDSPNAVVGHLRALERQGLIERDAKTCRGIRLTEVQPRGLQFLGKIS